ncbi:hypothetical protein AVEN_81976-1 [Araneus ventricosus]|uniref:Uncharacterized protein n=1 Tax=Araneus ventricosus TaxID=182803 RepID=A0A4Y2R2E4_ARAVE|nr:hypothetical protein AVEN_81976-1 [Araneus ventricosus]
MVLGDSCCPSDGMFTPKRPPADHLPDWRTSTTDQWPCVGAPRMIRSPPSWERPVCPPKCNGRAGPWRRQAGLPIARRSWPEDPLRLATGCPVCTEDPAQP